MLDATPPRAAWDWYHRSTERSVPKVLALGRRYHLLDLTDSLRTSTPKDVLTTRTALRDKVRRGRDGELAYESFCLTQAELATVSSEKDAAVLRALAGHTPICVVPNGTNVVAHGIDPSSEHGVLFVGDCLYRPNLEGLLWFVREVWPLVREADPACTLNVVGSVQNRVASMLGAVPGVLVHGHVPDVDQYLSQTAVVVNPVLTGSGTAFKSLEAMAWGKALVTTPTGARSLGLTPGVDGLVVETAEEFAAAVCRCLMDPGLRTAMGAAATRRAAERFAWSTVTAQWRALILGVAGGGGSKDT